MSYIKNLRLQKKDSNKIRDRRSFNRFISLFLLLSFSISSIIIPIFSNKVLAEDTNITSKTTTYLRVAALKGCILGATGAGTIWNLHDGWLHDFIDDSNASSGLWFNESIKMAVGYVSSDTGEQSCNEILSQVKSDMGYSNYAGNGGLLCDLMNKAGLKRDNGTTCEAGSDKFKNISSLTNAFDELANEKIYENKGITLDDAGWYFIYKSAFFKGCNAKDATGLTVSEDERTYINVNTVGDDGVKSGKNYQGDKKSEQRTIRTDLGDKSPVKMSCSDIASNVNKYVDAYVAYLKANPTEKPNVGDMSDPGSGAGDGKTTCAVDGVGWIVCPVMNFLATITEQAFNVLANNFLRTDTKLIGSDSENGTYKAWKIMRDIANVAFVIAFLIIIFSQLSSIGLDNYGIKKLLPKIIIAAIMVNLSYIICQIAVDISNILGFSLKNLFDGLGTYMKTPETVTGSSKAALEFAGTVTALLAGGITFALVISIPIIISAFFALMVILIILMARTALIILLIVISPLAFVAFLLPNTEEYFTKWRKMFTALLLVFPIISVVFGASGLAANIIKSASDDDFGKIMALGIATIPLFIVPGLLKKAIDSAGNIGAKISGSGDKMSSHFSKKGEEAFNTSRLGQYQKFRQQEKATRKGLIQSGAYKGRFKYDPRNAASRINREINDSKLSGRFGDYSSASGIDASEKIKDEQVKMQRTLIADGVNKSSNGVAYASGVLDDAMKSGDSVKTRAAYAELIAQGGSGVEKAREIIEKNSIATATNPINDKQNIASNDLRKYIKTNNSEIENKDARIFEWAIGTTASIANTSDNSSNHLKTLSNAQVISQTPESIKASNIDKARAMEILADKNLERDFKSKQVDALKEIIRTRP